MQDGATESAIVTPTVQLNINLEHNVLSAAESHDTIVLASLIADEVDNPDDDDSRPPLDVVLVLDCSGSMGGEKMELLKETIDFLVQHLNKKDRMALVSFSSGAQTRVDFTYLNADGKELVRDAVGTLGAGGGTNLSGGLFQGLSLINQLAPRRDGAVAATSCFLLTDGQANAGVQEPSELLRATMGMLESIHTKLSIHTFGYGRGVNSDLLKSITDAADGLYYFIEDNDSVHSAFADCVGGVVSVLAQATEMKLTPEPGVKIVKVHCRDSSHVHDDGSVTVSCGDMSAGETKDVPVQLAIDPNEGPEQPVLHVEVSFLNVKIAKLEKRHEVATVKRSKDTVESAVNVEVDKHRCRVRTASALDKARELGNAGQMAEARQVLEGALSANVASPAHVRGDSLVSGLVNDLREVSQSYSTAERYRMKGRHDTASLAKSHWMQKAAMFSSPSYEDSCCMAEGMSPQYQGCDSYTNRSRTSWRKRSSAAVRARVSKRAAGGGRPPPHDSSVPLSGDATAQKASQAAEPDTK